MHIGTHKALITLRFVYQLALSIPIIQSSFPTYPTKDFDCKSPKHLQDNIQSGFLPHVDLPHSLIGHFPSESLKNRGLYVPEGKGCKLHIYPYRILPPPKTQTKIKRYDCFQSEGDYNSFNNSSCAVSSPCARHHAEDSTSIISYRGLLTHNLTNGETGPEHGSDLPKVSWPKQ